MQTRQRDLIRESPAEQAKVWRIAAETSRRQFPHVEKRAREYEREAERYEQQVKEQGQWAA